MNTTFKNIEKAVEILNGKFSTIPDFKVRSVDWPNGKIEGGFYWMNHNNTPSGKYPFHEVFIKEIGDSSVDEIVEFATNIVMKKLSWQKDFDENHAREFNKKVEYKYNYTALGL